MPEPLLQVRNLVVDYRGEAGWLPAVDGVDLDLCAGEILALAGESGCGKSTLLMAMAGLLPASARVRSGSVRLAGRELVGLGEPQWRQLRGRELVWLPQNPMNAFNPILRVGKQLVGLLAARRQLNRADARVALCEGMARLNLSDKDQLLDRYPHELSGGTRQRLLMALALACRPSVLLTDEPSSALDAGNRATLFRQMRVACLEQGVGMITVTHDLALVAGHCERVGMMYCGQIVESGPVLTVFETPRHPYTAALLASHPAAHRAEPGQSLAAIPGQPLAAAEWATACRFANRCAHQRPRCTSEQPRLEPDGQARRWRCHFPLPDRPADHASPSPDQSSSISTKTGSS